MELYLFLALLLIYILTAFMVKKVILHKIWTLAFILAFVVTAVSIAFIRVSGQDVMMSANELNWYYLLYLFGSLSVVLGIINATVFGITYHFNTKEKPSRKILLYTFLFNSLLFMVAIPIYFLVGFIVPFVFLGFSMFISVAMYESI